MTLTKSTAKIRILNEVHVLVIGLRSDHMDDLVNTYAILAANYFFNPKYKLGRWDGKINFFKKDGRTYLFLLEDLIPRIAKLGYQVELDDKRSIDAYQPDYITTELFQHINHPQTGKPIILRDDQVTGVNKLIEFGFGVCVAGTGAGKAHHKDTLILTTQGWIKIGNITRSHKVITPDNKISNITGIFPQGKKELYEITFDDGATNKCCKEHLWEVFFVNANKQSNNAIYSTAELINILSSAPAELDICVPVCSPLNFYEIEKDATNLTISPYEYGQLIGKGNQTIFNPLYIHTSINDRYEFIKGLFDKVGQIENGNTCIVCVTELDIAKDVQYIIRSIGGICEIVQSFIGYKCKIKHPTLQLLFNDIEKIALINANNTPFGRKIVGINKAEEDEAVCIQISDPKHLYIADEFIVTHNTFMCAALVTAYDSLDVKSITIVPDQTLIKQTKRDYINCGLDTGEYSGTIKDLNHSHIVSTWQSIQHNRRIMTEFNMVIVDECHGLRGSVLQDIICEHAAKIPYRFGFTGTLPKDAVERMSVHVAVGPERHNMPAHKLIEMGVLSTVQIDILQLTEDFYAEYKEWCKNESFGKPPSYQVFKEDYFPDYATEKSYLHKKQARLKWIANFIIKKKDNKKGNVLCLIDNIAFGRKLTELIPGAIFINGQDVTKAEKRQSVYDMFATNDNLVVIATIHVAGTGLSINRIFNLVTIDVGKSFIRVIQAIGRGLRTDSDKNHLSYTDICSDLKYGNKHLNERIKFYKESHYPHKKNRVPYEVNYNGERL